MIKKTVKQFATAVYLGLKEKTFKSNETRLRYVEYNGGGAGRAYYRFFCVQ